MGFWDYPARGIRTPSHEWMTELLEAQAAGGEPTNRERLRLDAGEIARRYSEERLPGHAAWIDGDWKLHRIEKPAASGDAERTPPAAERGSPGAAGGEVRFELYDLARDPLETVDRCGDEPERAARMRRALAEWQRSVVRSLNGEDY
jgi:hypothetical protein